MIKTIITETTEKFDEEGNLIERTTKTETTRDDKTRYPIVNVPYVSDCNGTRPLSCEFTTTEDNFIRIPVTDNIKIIPHHATSKDIKFIEINDSIRLIMKDGKIEDWYEPNLDRVL